MRRDELVPRLAQTVRRAWPGRPATWSEAWRDARPATAQLGRLAGAAVLAYLGSTLLTAHVVDLTAPLTALLVVQASTVGTLRMGLVRVGAVLTGVLIAIGFSNYVGLSWWSLGVVIAAALLLAKVLRLGAQSLETPISAMLILGVHAPTLAAETRVANTLVGAAVGIAFSLLLPVAIPTTRARDTVRDVARSQAALLDRIALAFRTRAPEEPEVRAWLDTVDTIGHDLAQAAATVDAIEENRKLNARALVAMPIHPELRTALERLSRCVAAERALLVMVEREASHDERAGGHTAELRGAFAVMLAALATGVYAFGDLVAADRIEPAEHALERITEVVAETRAVLTELSMIKVEPEPDTDTWMLQGSMLAAIDQILRQLDLEDPSQASAAWRRPPAIPLPARTLLETGQRLAKQIDPS